MNQKHSKVFFGWWIVAACFLNGLLLGGFVILGFTAFFEPIVGEFGWSYTQVSLASSFRGVEMGLLAPFIGFLVDRWGPRRIMLTGIIIIGVGLLFLSRINSLLMFYLAFVTIAFGVSGNSPTVVMTTMANWFRKRLGIATGIIGSGFAFGGLLIPFVVRLIDILDWRTALMVLGFTVWVIGIPLSLLLRHRPEQYGYLPDGEKSLFTTPDQTQSHQETPETKIGARQALRSHTFWHIVIAMAFQMVAISTMIVHIMPYLSSVGIPRSTASFVAMVVPLASIIGRLGSGWLSDRFNKKKVAIVFFAMIVTGLLCMNYVSGTAVWMIVPFVLLFGIGWGGNNTLRVAMMSEYFGRRKFGSIFGFMMGVTVLGGLIGPIFAGWVYDTWATYQIALISLAVLVFLGLIIIATTPPLTLNGLPVSSDRH